jgi:hypothetical protein
MAATQAQSFVTSEMPDTQNWPLDAGIEVDDLEYAAIMRRIGMTDGASATPVSAFNSSI